MAEVASGVGSDDFVNGPTVRLDVTAVDLALFGKLRRVEDHLLGDVEGECGLVGVAGGGQNFRPRFVVGEEHVQRQRRGQRGLAVFATEHHQRLAVLAAAILEAGVEQRADDVPHLPAIEDQRLATERALGVGEKGATEQLENSGRFHAGSYPACEKSRALRRGQEFGNEANFVTRIRASQGLAPETALVLFFSLFY